MLSSSFATTMMPPVSRRSSDVNAASACSTDELPSSAGSTCCTTAPSRLTSMPSSFANTRVTLLSGSHPSIHFEKPLWSPWFSIMMSKVRMPVRPVEPPCWLAYW